MSSGAACARRLRCLWAGRPPRVNIWVVPGGPEATTSAKATSGATAATAAAAAAGRCDCELLLLLVGPAGAGAVATACCTTELRGAPRSAAEVAAATALRLEPLIGCGPCLCGLLPAACCIICRVSVAPEVAFSVPAGGGVGAAGSTAAVGTAGVPMAAAAAAAVLRAAAAGDQAATTTLGVRGWLANGDASPTPPSPSWALAALAAKTVPAATAVAACCSRCSLCCCCLSSVVAGTGRGRPSSS